MQICIINEGPFGYKQKRDEIILSSESEALFLAVPGVVRVWRQLIL